MLFKKEPRRVALEDVEDSRSMCRNVSVWETGTSDPENAADAEIDAGGSKDGSSRESTVLLRHVQRDSISGWSLKGEPGV